MYADLFLSASHQMMYTTSNIAWTRNLRTHVANCLGFWHTFKMAHQLVYRHYAMLFFAPLFHHIVPGHNFFIKPSRLIQIQEWFTLLRLAFDDEVQQATINAMKDARINDFSKSILGEFLDLCRYMIPVVRARAAADLCVCLSLLFLCVIIHKVLSVL